MSALAGQAESKCHSLLIISIYASPDSWDVIIDSIGQLLPRPLTNWLPGAIDLTLTFHKKIIVIVEESEQPFIFLKIGFKHGCRSAKYSSR